MAGSPDFDVVVIGAGIFGATLARALKERYPRILLIDREPDLLCRASYTNQARVHRGYHYPRSVLTALRSRVNFSRFAADFSDCIDGNFEKYYAVSRSLSKISAAQFSTFCRRIGAEIEPAPKRVKRLFDNRLVEDVFRVREYAFDAVKIREKLRSALADAGISLKFACEALKVKPHGDFLSLLCRTAADEFSITAGHVFSCTYSQMNHILSASGLPLIPLKHEVTELVLVDMPAELKSVGITIMDGPFCSIMPFPPRGLHTLSHVRYTPHYAWEDAQDRPYDDGDAILRRGSRKSHYPHMIRDAQRYLPLLKDCRYVESMWEVKTVLPRSEVDDSRPILVRLDHGLRNFSGILGAKVDNVYDVIDYLKSSELMKA